MIPTFTPVPSTPNIVRASSAPSAALAMEGLQAEADPASAAGAASDADGAAASDAGSVASARPTPTPEASPGAAISACDHSGGTFSAFAGTAVPSTHAAASAPITTNLVRCAILPLSTPSPYR
ncbi:hypothetical protein GCM10010988_18410 [Cnuibacter physcomitrellae]|nr:hypothetical protein GCM10010988_18410 [Cnuibacter physcomitrellae]